MERLASALRALQSPQPIPALRPIHVALRVEAVLTHSALVAVTDLLVDSANTVDAVLRDHLPSGQLAPGERTAPKSA